MLLQAFASGDIKNAIYRLLLLIPVLLISLTVHEVCHGYMAYKLGDPTARNLGRLSLNPIKHIDPIGAIMLLLFGFGYAKPVPVNARYFKKPRRDFVLVSLAGPVSNFILAFFGTLLLIVFALIPFGSENLYMTVNLFFFLFVQINIGLGVFNLIPIPPLDGSRLITCILPRKWMIWFFKYERYIQIVLFLLLWRGVFDAPLFFMRDGIFNLFISFWGYIISFFVG